MRWCGQNESQTAIIGVFEPLAQSKFDYDEPSFNHRVVTRAEIYVAKWPRSPRRSEYAVSAIS